MIENKTTSGHFFPMNQGVRRTLGGWRGKAYQFRNEGGMRLHREGIVDGTGSPELADQGREIPLPSTTVKMRSISGTRISSVPPLGQRISSLSTLVAAPRPKWTRWSELEA